MRAHYFAAAIGISVWTIGCLAVWFVLLSVIAFVSALVLPFRVETSASYRPASGAYQRMDVDAVSEILPGDDIAQRAHVTVTLTKPGSTHSPLTVEVHDVDRAESRIVGPDAGAAPIPLDTQNVLRWLKGAGIDTTDAQVIGEAQELIQIIHGMAAGPKGGPPGNLRLLTQQKIHSGPRQLPSAWGWLNWLPLVGAVVLWIVGLVLILRASAPRFVAPAPLSALERLSVLRARRSHDQTAVGVHVGVARVTVPSSETSATSATASCR